MEPFFSVSFIKKAALAVFFSFGVCYLKFGMCGLVWWVGGGLLIVCCDMV